MKTLIVFTIIGVCLLCYNINIYSQSFQDQLEQINNTRTLIGMDTVTMDDLVEFRK